MSLVTNPQVLDRFDELLYNEPAAVLSDLMAVTSLAVSGGTGVGLHKLNTALKGSRVVKTDPSSGAEISVPFPLTHHVLRIILQEVSHEKAVSLDVRASDSGLWE